MQTNGTPYGWLWVNFLSRVDQNLFFELDVLSLPGQVLMQYLVKMYAWLLLRFSRFGPLLMFRLCFKLMDPHKFLIACIMVKLYHTVKEISH